MPRPAPSSRRAGSGACGGAGGADRSGHRLRTRTARADDPRRTATDPPLTHTIFAWLIAPTPRDRAAGAALAPALAGGMVVTLLGDLGAGKTTLVAGRAARPAVGRGAVKSPTYTLVEPYSLSSLYFYHFDFYRFAIPANGRLRALPIASATMPYA